MRNIFRDTQQTPLLSAATALAALPTQVAYVGSWQGNNTKHPVPAQFDLECWANGTVALTGMKLLGLVPFDSAISSDDVDTVDFANDELDVTSHGLADGDGPIRFTTTGALPDGIEADTDYWVIEVNSGTIKIATSLENALEGTAVAIGDAGTGTHSFAGASAKSHRWLVVSEALGPDADGAVSLTAALGWVQRFDHRPRVIAYGLIGTHPGTVQVNASVSTIRDI